MLSHLHPSVSVCCPGFVRESGGHLHVDQLPVCLPVRDRIRGRELLHHSGGDEEDEEGEGQQGQQGTGGLNRAMFDPVPPSSGHTGTIQTCRGFQWQNNSFCFHSTLFSSSH